MKKGLFLLAIILLGSLVNASFVLYNSSIDRTYSSQENIRGWINVSFQNELVISKIKSSFAGEIKLKDFLEENNADFSCLPENCESWWASTNPSASKSFSLNSGKEKILGLRIEGNFRSLNRLSFNISVNNTETCLSPLEIDFLENGVDWKSTRTGTSYSCYIGSGKGCFDSSSNLQEVEIGSTPYCEKIKLNAGSRFQLGAWIKKVGSWNSESLKMYLYSQDNEQLKSCNLPQPSDSGGEVYCNVSYFNPEIKDYYICIKASQAGQHRTRKENSGEKCGFYAYPGEQTEYNDYEIFAKSSRFLEVGQFRFDQQAYEKLSGSNLIEDAENYIAENYGDSCNPCILPIKFKANTDLNIRLENLDAGYSTYSAGFSDDKFYDITPSPAKINSSQQILDITLAKIKSPINYGNYNFYLYLDDALILTKQISVINNPRIEKIYPLNHYAFVKGKISAEIVSPRNISSYKWNFGDGSSEITNSSYIYHKYEASGSYSLVLEATDSSGYKTSKQVTIEVSSPAIKVNSTIQDYKKRLDNITSELGNFGWYKDELEKILGLEDNINAINSLEREYNSASSEEDYIAVMSKLNELKIPKTIKKAPGNVPVLVSQEDISSEAVSGILQDCGEACKKAVAAWNQNHLELNLKFEKVQAYYEDSVETLINSYRLEIKPDVQEEKELYLFIKDSTVKELDFRDISDYKVIGFDNIDSRIIEFTSKLSFDELGIFLTPEFSLINIDEQVICNQDGKCSGDETWRNCGQDCKPWGWVIILLLLLIAAALAAYLFLQWWYKEKYESSLFKNRNDLYNLLNFIGNGKSQGLSNREIASKLKSGGWKSEQINYSFKKFEGKAIMPLDFIKLFKKFGVNSKNNL